MKQIGKGRRGNVYMEEVDGKQIVTKKAKDESKKAAINKEIEIIKKINNAQIDFVPNIIESGDGFFKYEFIQGDRFDKFIKTVAENEKLELIKQLLDKIYKIDKLGIVHGEMIRPFSNILVNRNNEIYIIDFERGKFGDFSGKNLRAYCQWLLKMGYLNLQQVKTLTKFDDLEKMKDFILTSILATKVSKKEIVGVVCVIVILILIDQISKYGIYDLAYFQNFYFFSKVFNLGVAFGIPISSWIVYCASIVALIMFIYFYKIRYIGRLEFVLLLSGLFGNIIDRVWLGGVRDFIDMKIWPVFNIADVYLSLSVAIIIFRETFRK